MSIKLSEVAKIIEASFEECIFNQSIDHISIDSRSLQNNETTLFFAFRGLNHDAHNYINELYCKGVLNFVVHDIPSNLKGKANFLVVKNSLKAFQNYASYYRSQFNIPIIAITGSNGKTIVKEWLNYLLSMDFTIVRNPKSYNSQVGVPLSVLGINSNHTLGIFEAGISLPNEMQELQNILKPTIGVLTHIGKAHQEGFESLNQKIKEKLKLFSDVDILIHQNEIEITSQLSKNIKTFTWSFSNKKSDVFIENIKLNTFKVYYLNQIFVVNIPFLDEPSIENACTCLATLLYLNIDQNIIIERISSLYPLELRLQVKNGINRCNIIDDSLNADFQSLKIALDFLEQHKSNFKKTVILSDIFLNGEKPEVIYNKVKKLLQNNGIHKVIGIGNFISNFLKEMPNFVGFDSTFDFLKQFSGNNFENETILIKGARGFNFDEITVLLEEKSHETVLEINLNSVIHNLNFYKSKLKANTKIMVMVKAFGYGAGSYEIAKELQHHHVNYLGVAYADEGIELRRSGINIPIIVMNPEPSAFASILAYELEPEIYSLKSLIDFINFAQSRNVIQYPIHLKLDTGMHRLGFEHENISDLINILQKTNIVKVASIFSHLSSSDMPIFKDFTLNQIKKFESWSSEIVSTLQINPILHILNTSGIYNYSQYQYDMVRLGIGLYGVGNDEAEHSQLENVGTLKTTILQIRVVNENESIGYARRFVTSTNMKIAVIPIGYADGIPRLWGNENGYVLVNNKKASIVGSICMDSMMIDVTNISCSEGDEVIVFGKNLPVTELAAKVNTIPYEILTSISQRVKRVFFKE